MNSDMKKYVDYINNMNGNILLGCDGFVNETYEIVQKRKSHTNDSTIQDLKHFGN